jgi:hypothetical protein
MLPALVGSQVTLKAVLCPFALISAIYGSLLITCIGTELPFGTQPVCSQVIQLLLARRRYHRLRTAQRIGVWSPM